jgi:hypothetical protein
MPYSRPNDALSGHWISADDIVPSKELQSFARYMHACHLVGMYYDTEKYNPHRVARQLGFDQDCTSLFRTSDSKVSWRRYDLNPEHITLLSVKSSSRQQSLNGFPTSGQCSTMWLLDFC